MISIFVTRSLDKHEDVRKVLQDACEDVGEGIAYSVRTFSEITQDKKQGAAVTIEYRTDEGATNTFDLDIVYASETDEKQLQPLVHKAPTIRAATLENIIADKLAATHRFKGGNTRMKDIDDLWRLSQASGAMLDWEHLKQILKNRSVLSRLDLGWIGPDMDRMWANHQKRYKDLPVDLKTAFQVVNNWLAKMKE